MSDLVFISVFNYGAIEMAKNHIESLKRNNINNYIAYVTDEESYVELLNCNINVKKYASNSINKEKNDFATPEFNNLSYIRYDIISSLLKEGKTVWYCDVDTVILSDLNSFYSNLTTNIDMYFQDDINMVCTGCMLFRPTILTIKLSEFMYLNKNIQNNDQVFLNNVFRNSPSINIGIFNKKQFPNGLLYFNELKEETYFRQAQEEFKNSTEPVMFIHANYMVGLETKINALKSKNLWFI